MKYLHLFFCLIAGALLPLAFAPLRWFWLAPCCLAYLFYSWRFATPKEACWRGLCFGIGYFGVGVSWVFISIHRFGGSGIGVALLLTAALVLLFAAFIALQGYLINRCYGKANYLLIAPAMWTLIEWVRSWIFTGFPWLLVGYSQTDSWLRGYAPIVGVYGISFLVALTASLLCREQACLFRGLFHIKSRETEQACLFPTILILAIWFGGYGLTKINWTKPTNKQLTVSIVQGNIPQQMKWNSEHIINSLQLYQLLTEANLHQNLIVWPETAIPVLLHYVEPYVQNLSEMARKQHSSILTGIPIQTKNGNYYNAVIAVGSSTGSYHKRKLLPFGDYVPMAKQLRGIINFFNLPMSSFSHGKQQPTLIKINGIPFGIYICYEIAYANLVRSDLPTAQILATLSNDAWFGDSLANDQHLQVGQMRALETGRYMIFSTNDGITAIIGPDGKIIDRLPKFISAVLHGKVTAMQGSTPWVRLGIVPLIIGLLLFLLSGLVTVPLKQKN